jgi:hypothetical protein
MAATLINKGEGSKIPPVNDLPSPLPESSDQTLSLIGSALLACVFNGLPL